MGAAFKTDLGIREDDPRNVARDITKNAEGQWTEMIRSRPLPALGIAAGAGFIFGGGLRSRIGFALVGMVARVLMREAAMAVVAGQRSNGNRYFEDRKRA
jgi:hypothetical protein